MRRGLRIISLLMALLVMAGAVWPCASAQDLTEPASETVVNDAPTQEVTEQPVEEAEPEKEEPAESVVVEKAEPEVAEPEEPEIVEPEESEEPEEPEIVEPEEPEEPEIVEPEEPEEPEIVEPEEPEMIGEPGMDEKQAEETKEKAEPAEESETQEVEPRTLENNVPESETTSEQALNQVVEPNTNEHTDETSFYATIQIELRNQASIRMGDRVTLEAKITNANRSYTVMWQSREAAEDEKEDDSEWADLETGTSLQVELTEEVFELEYRVLLTADHGETLASDGYRMPVPQEKATQPASDTETETSDDENHSAEENTHTQSEMIPAENKEETQKEEPVEETALVILPEDEADETDIDWTEFEILVVTEEDAEADPEVEIIQEESEPTDAPVPETETVDSEGGDIEQESEPVDPENDEAEQENEANNEQPDGSEATEEEVIPEEAADGIEEAVEEVSEETVEAADETEKEAEDETADEAEDAAADEEAAEEAKAQPDSEISEEAKPRTVRLLSNRGDTVVRGETIRMKVDLSDFADCAEVIVIWEADKGAGWEQTGTGENFEYTASADSMGWMVRARVMYRP